MKPIKTERLIIREANKDDAPFIVSLLNSPNWIKFIGDRNIKTIEDAAKYIQNSLVNSYIQNNYGMYIVELISENAAIGLCGFLKREELDHVDIGYGILPAYEGNGYTFEAAKAIAENSPFKIFYGITSEDNKGSQRILAKLGLKHIRNFQFGNYKDESMLFFNGTE